ncbi:MAG: cation:proton antiporter [Verrucomicrobiota bacterium]|nr:cation:proton antiporter [Verrucomicrobiota bacterium]
MFLAAAAHALSVHRSEQVLFFVLLQLIIVIGFARLAGNVSRWMGQPSVVGEIIGGLLLGPSLFGRIASGPFSYVFKFEPSAMPMYALSQIGLILLMFQIGLDFDFSHLAERKNRRAVSLVSAASIVFPFGIGFAIARISYPYLAPAVNLLGYELFVATAFSITAIPILGRIMMEFGLTKTSLGAITITAAAVNDIIGWIFLAVISAMTLAQFSVGAVAWQLSMLAAYAVFCWFVVRPLLRLILVRFPTDETRLPGTLMAIILGAIFASAIATFKLGIFAIFGGFIMGVLLYREHNFVLAWKSKVANFVTIFFLPIFFTYTGLRTNVNGLNSWSLWGWCAIVIAGATLGKFGGSYLAARLAGMPHYESLCAGIMMNTRALMELIILNVGYDLGVIPPNVFTMLVLMAIFTTIATAPCLRVWLKKIGHTIPAHIDI